MYNSRFTNPQELDSEIFNCYHRIDRRESSTETGQTCCLDKPLPPNPDLDYIQFRGRKWIEILGYLIILHYCEDEVLYQYLRLDLQEFLEKNSQFYWTSVLVKSKFLFLRYLLDQEQISEKQFFSTICCQKNLEHCRSLIIYRFQKRVKPKRTIRRRGYRDKGTLPHPDERIRREILRNSEYLRSLQLEIEETRLLRQKESSLLEQHLSEGRTISDELKLKFRLKRKEKENGETA